MTRAYVYVILVALGCIGQAQADGLGERTIWQTGSMLSDEMLLKSEDESDIAFKISEPSSEAEKSLEQDDEKYIDLFKQIKVDVVAANKELSQQMNRLSTKANAKMLQEYERFYKELGVGSTSRPMLATYLGLKFATDQELGEWYKPGRKRHQFLSGCKSLLEKRSQVLTRAISLGDGRQLLQELIKQKANNEQRGRQLALLLFKSNLNLFMLENYAQLCARLEGEQLSGQLNEGGIELLL